MSKRKNKVGRPRDGKAVKEVCSFRVEKKVKKLIVKKFGSVQVWVDRGVDEIKKSEEK